jgi:hypothetical protein
MLSPLRNYIFENYKGEGVGRIMLKWLLME